MIDGFLPYSRASFMLDFVGVAMFGIIPVLTWSIYEAKFRKNYNLHKWIQISLGVTLLVAVTIFEIDVRLYGWRHLAEPSPYYDTWLFPVLYVHLFFSCTTSLLWLTTIIQALRHFPSPPMPCDYSRRHVLLGRLSAITMYCTAVTGWTFYWMAFVATPIQP